MNSVQRSTYSSLLAQFVHRTLVLTKKDLACELRLKESLAVGVSLALVLAGLVALGLSASAIRPQETKLVTPLLIWMIFLFSSSLALSRIFEFDMQNDALDGLALLGVTGPELFVSKLIYTFVICGVIHLVAVLSLVLLLNLSFVLSIGFLCWLFLISILTFLAYLPLAILLSALVASSRLKATLMPLLLYPLLFPVFFAALSLTSDLFLAKVIAFDSFWFSLLLALDFIYGALAFNLIEHVIRD